MGILDRLGQRLSDWVDELSAPEEVRGPLQRGARALQAGAYAEAERELRRVVEEDARNWRGWHLLGLSQLRAGRPAEALASLGKAAEVRPTEFAVLVALGEAQRAAGQPDAALQSYKAALHVPADESLLDQVFAGLGEIYLERGDLDHAVRELRKAVAASRGEDLRLLGRLGVALVRAGELRLAETSLSRAATAVPADPEVVLLLSAVLLEAGRPEEARLAALRLLHDQPSAAAPRCALARALIALGQRENARHELLRALGDQPDCSEAHHLLGRVHLQAGDLEVALRHLRAADQHGGGGPELWREILELELELGEERGQALQATAERLLERCPGDALGLSARALAEREPGPAVEALRAALRDQESFGARLAMAILQLDRGDPAEAVISLRAAVRLRPGSRRARALLEAAHRALAGLEEGPTTARSPSLPRSARPLPPPASLPPPATADLYPLIRRAHDLFLSVPALSGLGAEVARIQEVFDRPLLCTVMGEFNSGKSTFVNALIGERVAPMGVTPTTATINVLKYGPRRGARIIRRDDREVLLSWDEVEPLLSGLDRRRASEIRLVEILYPSEELLRVNVVDTPGLNSMIEEHEQTAREVMAQADAVIWLFSAQQAGKQTEEQALELIAQYKLKTVGVLNKIDQIGAEELGRVLEHLRGSFGRLTEEIVPVSARQALEALLSGERERLEESRFPALRQLLEERLFARGRAIKHETAARRLGDLLLGAEKKLEVSLQESAGLATLLDRLSAELTSLLPPSLMEREGLELRAALDRVYRRGAEEVLDFVRPRRWAFGEHRATRADRDFLLELLVDGLQGMAAESHARMAGQLRRAARQLEAELEAAGAPLGGLSPAVLLEPLAEERAALLEQQVYARYIAFARGLLLGGRVDHFFAHRLPHLELALEPIHEALREDSVDIDRELLLPLGEWYGATRAALAARLDALRVEVDLGRLELEQRGLAPLLWLRHKLTGGASS